jgi:5-methylcytosine-specific restriction protein A
MSEDINFTVKDFAHAFAILEIAPHHKRMLQLHYHSPNRTITSSQMARAMGYKKFKAANLHYGRLAGLMGGVLRWHRPKNATRLFLFAEFQKPHGEWWWIMRPQVAKALEQLGMTGEANTTIAEEITDSTPLYEGAVTSINVNAYERSGTAREECILKQGCKCAVCGVILADIYGEVAQGFIHVHHLTLLAVRNGSYEINPQRDLRPVCPNCHAIIHLKNPPYTIQQARSFLGRKKI